MPEASDRSQFHSGSWGFHMEHRDGTPPWDTRPDLVAVPATKPDVVIRGYDDRGDESAERAQRAVPPPAACQQGRAQPRRRPPSRSRPARQSHRSPSRPGNSHPAVYLLLTCLGVLVLPGVIAVALWLRSGWSLSPSVLIPPSSGRSGEARWHRGRLLLLTARQGRATRPTGADMKRNLPEQARRPGIR